MASADAVRDTADTLGFLLRGGIPAVDPAKITVATPDEFVSLRDPAKPNITVFLYRIGVNAEMRNGPRRLRADGTVQPASLPLRTVLPHHPLEGVPSIYERRTRRRSPGPHPGSGRHCFQVRLWHQSRRVPAMALTVGPSATTPFDANDFRKAVPRFTPEARAANLALVELLKRVAERKHATPAQIALAWLLAQKPWIVPIPGTTKLQRVEENLGAADVTLTADDLHELETAASKIPIQGARLPEAALKWTNG